MNTSGQLSQQQQQQQKQAGGYHISSTATAKRRKGPATPPHALQNQAQLQKIMSLFQ
jgi:hypothetical protein